MSELTHTLHIAIFRIENIERLNRLVLDDVHARPFELDAGLREALAKNVKNIVEGGFTKLFDFVFGKRFRAPVGDVESFVLW